MTSKALQSPSATVAMVTCRGVVIGIEAWGFEPGPIHLVEVTDLEPYLADGD